MIFEKWDHSMIVSIGVVIGGLLTKILTGRQRKTEMKYDEAAAMRKELRDDVAGLKDKIGKICLDLDTWKEKYYKLADENIQLRSRCRSLEIEVEELRKKIAAQTNPDTSSLESDSGKQMQ